MTLSSAEFFRTFGFVILRQFFDPHPLAAEIDQVMRDGLVCQVARSGGIDFRYVPMMTAETPASLSLLDRSATVAEALLAGPVLPTRAKGTLYRVNTPWHTDSESPITSIGFIAYLESLEAENGAPRRLAPSSASRAHGTRSPSGGLGLSGGGAGGRKGALELLSVRTLPQYLDAFLDTGLHLTRIVDVDHPAMAARRASGEEIPLGEQLPRFMVLAFAKP